MSADPTDAPLTDPPGDGVTFGHFVVPRREDGSLWKLGEGSMGTTYRAFDTSLRVEVALKVIAASRVNDENTRRRFQREARAAAKIRHPNIASVLYLGEEGGEFFYAMEFVPGVSLDGLLKQIGGPLPPPVALALTAQVAAALSAAHKRELVHRDLKPANLMVLDGEHLDQEDVRTDAAGRRQVKVIDFGLARSFGVERHDESFVTQTTSGFLGTPIYASPEQIGGEDTVDGRSDLYSLGVVLWQMLVGNPPYRGTVVEVMRQHLFKPVPLEQLPAGLPASLITMLEGLLIKEPAQRRPQTAGELRTILDDCLRGVTEKTPAAEPDSHADPASRAEAAPPAIHRVTVSAAPVPAPTVPPPELPATPGGSPARTRWWYAPATFAVVLLLAGIAVWWWQLGRTTADKKPMAVESSVPPTPAQVTETPRPSTPAISVAPVASPGPSRAAEQEETVATPAPPPDPQALADVETAFKAMKEGDFAGARKQFTKLANAHPAWPTMRIEAARSELYEHKFYDAEAHLLEGRPTAEASFLLGLLFMVQSEFGKADDHFRQSVNLDPTRPDYYYFWGENLRREGKSEAAADRFRSALVRNQFETNESLYTLKLWLSEIDAGQGDTNGDLAKIDTEMASENPSGAALFADAARSIRAKRYRDAANQVKRAQKVMEPAVFRVILQDPTFLQENYRPEFAPFYKR